jgi:hypothetical protein
MYDRGRESNNPWIYYVCHLGCEIYVWDPDVRHHLPRQSGGLHLVRIGVGVVPMRAPAFNNFMVARLDDHASQSEYIAPAIFIVVYPDRLIAAFKHGFPVLCRRG